MINLIRKEIFVLSYYHLFVLLYVVFFGVLFLSKQSPALISALPAMMLMMFASNLEMRNKSALFVGSLPVRRKQIVLAKYVCVLIYAAVGLVLSVLVMLLNKYALGREMAWSFELAAAAVTVDLLFFSLYFPIYYRLGQKGAQFVVYIVIFLMAFGIVLLTNEGESMGAVPLGRLSAGFGLLLPVAGLALLAVSYRVSAAIFQKKDIDV